MENVKKTLKVSVEIDGKKEVLEINKAIEAVEENIKSLHMRASIAMGTTQKTLEETAKKQEAVLKNLQEQQKQYEALSRAEEKLARQEKARAEARAKAEELRAKRREIESKRATQQVWSSGNLRTIAKHYSPVEKLRRQLDESRATEDEQLRLSVYGETPDVRAAAKAAAQKAGSKSAELSGKLGTANFVLSMLKAVAKALKFYVNAAKAVARSFEKISGITLSIKTNFNEILSRSGQLLNPYTGAASYSPSSLVVNAAARRTQLTYGMTGAQAWGFNQASSMFGVSGVEDLLYMSSGQRAAFTQYMQRQEQMFARLERSGVLESIQELQLDFKLFKQELSMEFLEWIANNKDLILAVMKLTLNVLKGLLTAASKVATLFGIDTGNSTYGLGSSAMSDASSINNAVSNRSIRVSMTNNINGLFGEKQVGQLIDEKNEALVRAVAAVAGG